MIEIVKTGMCRDCKNADLVLERLYSNLENYWSIRCQHEYACNSMKTKTIVWLAEEEGWTKKEEETQ